MLRWGQWRLYQSPSARDRLKSTRAPRRLLRSGGAGSPSPWSWAWWPSPSPICGSCGTCGAPGRARLRPVHLGLLLRPTRRGPCSTAISTCPTASLGIEAFGHDGRQFTYFGIFPSLLRMPVLLVTNRLDGRLTAPSLLLSWVVTGVFSSLLVWRLRLLIRGQAVLGRAEAASYGLFVATIGGGSVLDLSGGHSLRLTTRTSPGAWPSPSPASSRCSVYWNARRGAGSPAAGVLILAANLDRTPTGWGCVIGAGTGRRVVRAGPGRCGQSPLGRAHGRRGGGAVRQSAVRSPTPSSVSPSGCPWPTRCGPSSTPTGANSWPPMEGRRSARLFLPSTLVAYLQPFGIRLTRPLPVHHHADGARRDLRRCGPRPDLSDRQHPADHAPPVPLEPAGVRCRHSSRDRPVVWRSPGSCWWPPPPAPPAFSCGVYIADRYMADFMPFLILAGAIGMIELWRRLDRRGRRLRAATPSAGSPPWRRSASWPTWPSPSNPRAQFNHSQLTRFVTAEKSLSVQSLASTVHHGATLPYWAPAGELYIVGDCSGLYYSTGDSFKNVPGHQLMHWTWMPVEQGPRHRPHHRCHLQRGASGHHPPGPDSDLRPCRRVPERRSETKSVQLQVVNAGANSIAYPPTIGPRTRSPTTYVPLRGRHRSQLERHRGVGGRLEDRRATTCPAADPPRCRPPRPAHRSSSLTRPVHEETRSACAAACSEAPEATPAHALGHPPGTARTARA